MPLITNDAIAFGLLMITLAVIFAPQTAPAILEKFYIFIPPYFCAILFPQSTQLWGGLTQIILNSTTWLPDICSPLRSYS